MAYPRIDEMVWIGNRWWWFPAREITVQSQFAWKNDRAYLLEPNGYNASGVPRQEYELRLSLKGEKWRNK